MAASSSAGIPKMIVEVRLGVAVEIAEGADVQSAARAAFKIVKANFEGSWCDLDPMVAGDVVPWDTPVPVLRGSSDVPTVCFDLRDAPLSAEEEAVPASSSSVPTTAVKLKKLRLWSKTPAA